MGGKAKPRPHRMRGLPTPAETRALSGTVLLSVQLTREQYACVLELMETGLYGERMNDVVLGLLGSAIRRAKVAMPTLKAHASKQRKARGMKEKP